MLGAAAIGKSTQLKRFAIEALNNDLIPILILVIELVRLAEAQGSTRSLTSNHNGSTPTGGPPNASGVSAPNGSTPPTTPPASPAAGEDATGDGKGGRGSLANLIMLYIKSKYPSGSKQYRLHLQAVHERRALFLIDGVDEAGGHRRQIETVIASELLDQGHKAIITSRHSGFNDSSFQRCKLVELLPMSSSQKQAMVLLLLLLLLRLLLLLLLLTTTDTMLQREAMVHTRMLLTTIDTMLQREAMVHTRMHQAVQHALYTIFIQDTLYSHTIHCTLYSHTFCRYAPGWARGGWCSSCSNWSSSLEQMER
jgi:hypothetical protein